MTKPPEAPTPIRPRVTTLDAYRLLHATMDFGHEALTRGFAVTSGSLRRSTVHLAQGLLGQWNAPEVLRGVGAEYVKLLTGLASVLPAAAEAAAARVGTPRGRLLSEFAIPIEGAIPERSVRMDHVEVPAEGGRAKVAFLLPERIVDASQGWAVWFVPVAAVQALLAAGAATGTFAPGTDTEAFVPLDSGGGRTMVMLTGVDYRATDYGGYRELGLLFSVTPAGDPVVRPGSIFARLIVSDPYSLPSAKQVWGLRKEYEPGLHVDYATEEVRFHVGQHGSHAGRRQFSLGFPRFGGLRSDGLLSTVYSVAALEGGPSEPVHSTLTRTGVGEGMQFGGNVALCLPKARRGDPPPGTCFCRQGGSEDPACLCDTLLALGMDRLLPAANGWTERMSGSFGEPAPVRGWQALDTLPDV